MKWLDLIVSVLAGLAVCLPLAVKLVQYVTAAVKEKNWTKLLELVMKYMATAETKFADGATRKEWVLAMVQASAKELNYDVDIDAVGKMIDKLCGMSKVVNAPSETDTAKADAAKIFA